MPGHTFMPDDASRTNKGKAQWREPDVTRAISAAEKAGLELYRVELAPDGTISIVVGADSLPAGNPDIENGMTGP